MQHRRADVSHAAPGIQYLLSATLRENLIDKAPGSNPEDIAFVFSLIEGLAMRSLMRLSLHPASQRWCFWISWEYVDSKFHCSVAAHVSRQLGLTLDSQNLTGIGQIWFADDQK